MDVSRSTIYGPHPVQRTGTVTVPRELLNEVGVEAGTDRVHWALNPQIPGTLLLIPSALVGRSMTEVLDALRRHSG